MPINRHRPFLSYNGRCEKMTGSLNDSVSVLTGVGPKREQALNDLGIATIKDLILYFPFRYNDIRERSLATVNDGDKVLLKGSRISDVTVSYFGRRKNRLAFRMLVNDEPIQVVFFNQPYLKDKINQQDELAIYGRWEAAKQTLLGIRVVGGASDTDGQDFEAVYPASNAIKSQTIKNLVIECFKRYKDCIKDPIPSYYLRPYDFMPFKKAYFEMHFKTDDKVAEKAREQLVFYEFLTYQLKLLHLKYEREKAHNEAAVVAYDLSRLKDIISHIPFELTDGQKQIINSICRDLLAPYPMNRLLQGDVGSGKTVVAFVVMGAVFTSFGQAVLMAPTELLAEQHYQSALRFFEGTPYNIALLTGSTKPKDRRQILLGLKTGEISGLIGTHAVFQDEVVFDRLQLAIIDEQHRFGVKQRQQLIDKGEAVNTLVMTATPIPRTLAITLYGDLDVSQLKEMPAGRQKITTRWVRAKQLDRVYPFILREIENGRQAYVISPLIEESENSDRENATAIFNGLKTLFPSHIRLGLLHGRLDVSTRQEIMAQFKNHEIDVLVSTTVIEVGVDVPNATIMLIYNADQFGLSQLHQLRGRVGRGKHKSYCILSANPKTETGKERMQIMCHSQDGFYLSQRDLEMRGPGEIFGERQSGLPEFKVGDLINDADMMIAAADRAHDLIMTNQIEKELDL